MKQRSNKNKKNKRASHSKRKKLIALLAIVGFVVALTVFAGGKITKVIQLADGLTRVDEAIEEKLPDMTEYKNKAKDVAEAIVDKVPGKENSDGGSDDKESKSTAGVDDKESKNTAGVDDKVVIKDKHIYTDAEADWKWNNVKVLKHNTEAEAGRDVVTVYMELKNDIVHMAGTKQVTYEYDDNKKTWKITDAITKLSCIYVNPI